MLDKIIRFSIGNKLVISVMTVALIVWGSYSLTQLPIDAVPDITNNQVQVLTTAPSQSAQDIERLVTFPIEQVVSKIPGVEEIRSISRFGLSVVTIVFGDKIDIYWARQQVNEKLSETRGQIPAGVGTPELAPVTTGLGEIYQYILHSAPGYEKKYDATELRSIQDWFVRRQLLGVRGIADVSSFGGFLKQYEVAVDPDKLKSLNITIGEIFQALENNNQNTGGAYIDKKPNAYFIRSEGLIKDLEDIQDIVIKNTENGTPVLIRDISEVRFGHAVRYGAMTRNDEGEVVGGIVLMLKGANASKVIKDVKTRIDEIQNTLPEGVVIEPFLDRTKLVNNAIGTVTTNLAEGALIVIFILVLFLGNLRAGLVVASVIPLSMLFAISLMNLFGVSGNLMSLGAIDFGLIVDGAVIIVEATIHHLGLRKLNRPRSQKEMDAEVYESASQIRTSAAFGEIIILIVYLPILALSGIEGKMFKPMAQTVSFAILGAFILSLTYVPMVSAIFLSKKPMNKKTVSGKIIEFLSTWYTPLLQKALRRPAMVITSAVILFLISLVVFRDMGAEFLPSLDEGDFAVETRVLTGSSLSETIDAAQKASHILLKNFPDEVHEVVGKIGSSEIPVDPMPLEACDLIVILKERKNWTRAKDKNELAEKMSEALEDLPGVTFGFQQPIQMRFNELMSGARQDVVLKLYGEDLETLALYAEQISSIIPSIEGTRDVYTEKITGLPQIVIRYKRDQIGRYGMNLQSVNHIINSAFAGQKAGIVYEGEKRYDLVVRLSQESRSSITDVANLYIPAPSGIQIPLEQIAEVRFETGPNQIQRDNARRRIIIGFNVRGRDVESIVKDLKKSIHRNIDLPPGYHISYSGTFENLQQARGRLSLAVPLALLLIMILLYFTFHSLIQSLLIFAAIPLSAIGGVLALWIRDMPFSISAGVGFIALFGVAVLNGIVLIAEFNRLKKEGVQDVRSRILQGALTRLRLVVMTATVASLGFLPMALSKSSGAEVQKPLATVVIGGLVTATLLTLVVIPCLYLVTEQKMQKRKSIPGSLLIFYLLFSASPLSGQVSAITADSAVSIAMKNNPDLRSIDLEKEFYLLQKKTSSQVPKTDITVMIGQYNSFYKGDNNISITQVVPFPGTGKARHELADAQAGASDSKRRLREKELELVIRQICFNIRILSEQKKLLLMQDSLFRRLSRAAEIQFRTGEGNLLSKTSAELREKELQHKLLSTENEIQVLHLQIRNYLGLRTPVQIIADTIPVDHELSLPDQSDLARHPKIEYFRNLTRISEKERILSGRSTLPDLKFGYFNQSLFGVPLNRGNTEFATGRERFQGFQAGLLFPIWFIPEINKHKSFKKQEIMSRTRAEAEEIRIALDFEEAVKKLELHRKNLRYFEDFALPNAELILRQSVVAYEKGETSYSEQVLGVQQAIRIREEHLQALSQFYNSVLFLEFLTSR